MYPYYTGYVEGMKLHSDDIAAIQSLYGNVLEFVCLFVFVFFFSLLLFLFFTTTFMPCDSCSIIRPYILYPSVSIKGKNIHIRKTGYIANTFASLLGIRYI